MVIITLTTAILIGSITVRRNVLTGRDADVELSYDTLATSTTVTKKQQGQNDNLILPNSNLAVLTAIASSQVPLWLTCGPSLRVLTSCEFTANFLSSLLQGIEEEVIVDGGHDDGVLPDVQSSRALLVRVDPSSEIALEKEDSQGIASEIVIYGIWKQSEKEEDELPSNGSSVAITIGEEGQTLSPIIPQSTRSLSIFALPLSSAYALPATLSLKLDPDATVAVFLSAEELCANRNAAQSVKKRKSVTAFDTIAQAKRGRRISDLPPGLQRPVSSLSNHSTPKLEQFSLLRSKTDLLDYDPVSFKELKSDGRQQSIDNANDYKSWRSLKRSSSSMGYRDKDGAKDRELSMSARFHSREPSVVSIYPNLHIPDHKQRHRSVTRPLADSTQGLDLPSVSNPFVDKNKPVLQKLVMANLTSLGMSRKKIPITTATTGSDDEDKDRIRRAQAEDDEYKLIYHTVLKSVTFALRKIFEVEIVETRVMKELVEVFGSAYVLGRAGRDGQSNHDDNKNMNSDDQVVKLESHEV